MATASLGATCWQVRERNDTSDAYNACMVNCTCADAAAGVALSGALASRCSRPFPLVLAWVFDFLFALAGEAVFQKLPEAPENSLYAPSLSGAHEVMVTADLVVAADGVNSRARTILQQLVRACLRTTPCCCNDPRERAHILTCTSMHAFVCMH